MARQASSPPRGTAWVLARMLPPAFRADILGDIYENFAADVTAVGRWRAVWRFRIELFSLVLLRLRGRVPKSFSSLRSPSRENIMASFVQDIRFALKRLVLRPGFALLVVLLLALGLGATTTLYTVLDGIFLRPVPYASGERLVSIGTTFSPDHTRLAAISLPNYEDVRESTDSVEAIGAVVSLNIVAMGSEGARKTPAAAFSEDFLSLLGVQPLLGRTLTASEHRGEGEPVALVSHGAWQRLFGGVSDLSGAEVRTPDETYRVVGVLPPDFIAPEAADVGGTDLWVPLGLVRDQIDERSTRMLAVIGRLAPTVELPQAQAELDALAARLATAYPESNAPGEEPFGIGVRSLRSETAGSFGTGYAILVVAVGLLFMIACVNIASLLLAQGRRRVAEVALRTALGAPRGRIVRQLLVESAVLAVLGGLAGVGVAYAGVAGFINVFPGSLPRAAEIGIDARVLGFAFGLSLLTGVGCGLAPALRLVRDRAAAPGDMRGTSDRSGRRFQSSLVMVEIAFAVVLLTTAGLLVNSFARLQSVDPGFDAAGLVVVRADPGAAGADWNGQREYALRAVEEVRSLPAVESAGVVVNLPLGRLNWRAGVTFEDGTATESGVNSRVISAGYLDTLGVPIVAGRDFNASDDVQAPPVVIVNETFVRRYLGAGPTLGRVLTFSKPFLGEQVAHTVVGVVGDMKERLNAEPAPEFYVPLEQNAWPNIKVVYRPRTEAASVAGDVLDALRRVDSGVPVDWQRSLDEVVGGTIGRERFLAQLLSIVAIVAVMLAAGGVFALVAHSVQGRRREIGIRMAVGANASTVVAMVLRQSLRLILAGLVIGLVGAALVGRLLASQLYEVAATDPLTYAIIALTFMAVAAIAAMIPARRASAIDPIHVLRSD